MVVWRDLMESLVPAFEAEVLVASEDGGSYRRLDGTEVDASILSPGETGQPLVLWRGSSGAWIRVFPLVIPHYGGEGTEALLLEEIKGKQLLYLWGDELIKRKGEFRELVQMLSSRMPEELELTSDELSAEVLGERVDRVTTRTLSAFEDTLKYIPGMYVERESGSEELDRWLDGDLPGCLIVGEPGVGKTSLVADWTVRRREAGDHVLLLEVSKLEDPDLPRTLEQVLGLRSPLKSCLEAVTAGDGERRFIVVIDAVNEFVGKDLGDRSVLWREINSLVERFDDFRPHIRCLVTMRSDVWRTDFPRADSVHRVLKRRLFHGSDGGVDFPVVRVGEFSAEEAATAYERARAEIPGMSPETSWDQLPEKVKQLARNPFNLRLLLRTYSGAAVPAVTNRKLQRAFAEEKALAEKERREVLFRLLTRMTELGANEVTLEEFLYEDAKARKRRRKDRDAVDLEKVVFDPRPDAPYRSLVDEGLIAERTVGAGERTEERLSFVQEKVLNLLDEEFRRERKRFSMRSALIFGLAFMVLFLGFAGFISWGLSRLGGIIHGEVAASSLLPPDAERVEGLIRDVIYAPLTGALAFFGIAVLLTVGAIILDGWIEVLGRGIGDRLFPPDFSTRALRERFRRKVQKVGGSAVVVLLLSGGAALAIRSLLGYPGMMISDFVRWALVFAFLGCALILASGIWVVARHAPTPNSAYVLFGWRAVARKGVETAFSLVIAIALTMIVFQTMVYFFDVRPRQAVDAFEATMGSDPALLMLERSERPEDWKLHQRALNGVKVGREYSEFSRNDLRRIIGGILQGVLIAAFVLLPLYALAIGLIGRPLERYLARRMAPPQEGT